MRYIALAVICVGFTAAAVYQQATGEDSAATSIAAFTAFVMILIPEEFLNKILERIGNE